MQVKKDLANRVKLIIFFDPVNPLTVIGMRASRLMFVDGNTHALYAGSTCLTRCFQVMVCSLVEVSPP